MAEPNTEPKSRRVPSRSINWDLIAGSQRRAFAPIAAIGGMWSAYEAHRASWAAIETAALETRSALVQSCTTATPALFACRRQLCHPADHDENDEYWNSVERADFGSQRPKKPRLALRCQFRTPAAYHYSGSYVYYRVGFLYNRTIRQRIASRSHSHQMRRTPSGSSILSRQR